MAVLTGFSGSINNNRKTDTTRSFESAIEAVYSGVRTGQATRQTSAGKSVCIAEEAFPGASNECLVIGKLLRFVNGSTVNVYNVISNIQPDTGCTYTGVGALQCYHPRVIDIAELVDTIEPPWQATVVRPVFQQRSNPLNYLTDVNLLAFLRHPASELVYILPIQVPDATLPNVAGEEYLIPGSAFDGEYANTKGQICIKHDGFPQPKSYVHFSGGEGVSSIDMSDNPILTGGGAPVCS